MSINEFGETGKKGRQRKPISLILIAVLALTALFAGGCKGSKAKQGDKKVSIGSKGFAESQIVSKLFQYALEDDGFKVEFIDNLDNEVLQSAIVSGKVDLYPEYTNTGISSILKLAPIFDTDEAYRIVKKEYKERFNIAWLEPSTINNTYCLVISKAVSDRLGIKNISQLQKNISEIRAAGAGWEDRPDHLPALRAKYGEFNFKSMTLYSGQLKYQVIINGNEDLTLGYTTDPQLENQNLVVLEDDKLVWPPYNLTPIVRQEVLDKYPEVETILNGVTRKLDTRTIIGLSAAVVIDHEEFDDVAKDFYKKTFKTK